MTPLENAKAFYREVASSHEVWTVVHEDNRGPDPAWPAARGMTIRPFWSSPTRAKKMITGPFSGRGFHLIEVQWDEFRSRIAPAMERDNQLVGVNWSGPRAKGYNIPPTDVIRFVIEAMEHHRDPRLDR